MLFLPIFLHENPYTSGLFCPILLPDVIKKHLENITDRKAHSNLKNDKEIKKQKNIQA